MEVQVQQQEERRWKMMTNYVRNARAVGVLWGFFTVCLAIIIIVVFIQPQWIGDGHSSPMLAADSVTGFFGLYEYCRFDESNHRCYGGFYNFGAILSPEFKAASLMVGIAALLILICILCFLLFLMAPPSIVYIICGVIQLICGVLLFLGCIIYPAGWDHREVRAVCRNSGKYSLGTCEIRYAYILAIIAIFDALILAVLAFVLSARQVKRSKEDLYRQSNTIARSDLMYNVETESKPSIAIQPVLTAPSDHGGDHYSEYTATSTKRSKHDFAL